MIPLPFDADANGILSLKLQSIDADKANGSLTFSTENTSFSAKGDVNLTRDNFLDGTTKLTLQSQDFEPFLLLQGIGLPQMGSGLPLTATVDVATSAEAVTLSNIEGKG